MAPTTSPDKGLNIALGAVFTVSMDIHVPNEYRSRGSSGLAEALQVYSGCGASAGPASMVSVP
jgi:hypothetical protein